MSSCAMHEDIKLSFLADVTIKESNFVFNRPPQFIILDENSMVAYNYGDAFIGIYELQSGNLTDSFELSDSLYNHLVEKLIQPRYAERILSYSELNSLHVRLNLPKPKFVQVVSLSSDSTHIYVAFNVNITVELNLTKNSLVSHGETFVIFFDKKFNPEDTVYLRHSTIHNMEKPPLLDSMFNFANIGMNFTIHGDNIYTGLGYSTGMYEAQKIPLIAKIGITRGDDKIKQGDKIFLPREYAEDTIDDNNYPSLRFLNLSQHLLVCDQLRIFDVESGQEMFPDLLKNYYHEHIVTATLSQDQHWLYYIKRDSIGMKSLINYNLLKKQIKNSLPIDTIDGHRIIKHELKGDRLVSLYRDDEHYRMLTMKIYQ